MKQATLKIDLEAEGVPLTVEGYYSPEEPMVMYYTDGSGYPGCAAEFDISAVKLQGTDVDIFDLLSENVIEEIEEKAIQQI
tara:strand:+ start:499 stop:741 length:243 start_codon:yes stop_codon:yes gene_type:complete